MTQLVEELRRRGVLKTAAMYAAGALLLTEVSATMLPALHFPDWALTAVVLLVLLGFPVTMILTWIFDVGPDGITRTAPLNRKGKLTFALAGIALIASTTGLVVLVFPDKHNIRESMGPSVFAPMANSVAVLPFEDTSRDQSQGYLVDGLADTLMTRRGQVDNVTVIARTSAFA